MGSMQLLREVLSDTYKLTNELHTLHFVDTYNSVFSYTQRKSKNKLGS